MTIEELRSDAHRIATGEWPPTEVDGRIFAQAVADLLGVEFPCGWDVPRAGKDTHGVFVRSDDLDDMTIDEARGLAIGILVACDEAEAKP